MRLLPFVTAAGLCLGAVLPAQAADESGTFNISIGPFSFGVIAYSANFDSGAYTTASRVEASGLVGAITRARYDAKSRGSLRGGRYVPALYEETSVRGDKNTQSVIRYVRGVPQGKEQTPPLTPREWDIDPAQQGGTVDPSTAIFATMRDVAPEAVCDLDISMYDGRYRARITLSNPQADGDATTCSGVYRRVGGYSDKEMADGSEFPFSARYEPTDDGMLRMTQVRMQTLYGTARVERR